MSGADLFSIANSGVMASNKLLQTTSKNIANVNTEGYVRERAFMDDSNVYGVEVGGTERIINVFAQNQLRRDITSVGELEAFSEHASRLDNILANDANSLSSGLSKFYASLQTAADDPTNLASREQVLSSAELLLRRMDTLNGYMAEKEKQLNLEFSSEINRANSLIKNIGQLNEAIQVAYGNNARGDEPSALLNERDQAINELASIMSIEVRESTTQKGALAINLTSGDSLVLENGSFNVVQVGTEADLSFKELELTNNFTDPKKPTTIALDESQLGGTLGGLFRFRDEVLGPAQRDIGQIGLAFADAMNSQNRLGMDLDGQLGGDLFTLPVVDGLPYDSQSNLSVEGRVTAGKGNLLTDADYNVRVTSVTGGVPDEVEVTLLNADGTIKTNAAGTPLVETISLNAAGYTEMSGTLLQGGFEIQFTDAGGYSVDDEFLLQPTKDAGVNIQLATGRAEDLAFAAPIRVEPAIGNLGNASVSGIEVTNTEVGTAGSAFDGNGGMHGVGSSPAPGLGAPAQIRFTSATEFEVYDSSSNLITTVSGVSDYNNLLEQAEGSAGWPAAFSNGYPGYDMSLEGVPQAGDSFSFSYNTNGFADNSNVLKMADLQDAKLVQLSDEPSNPQRSAHDAYASLVGKVGEQAATADTSLRAAEAMKTQSENWFDSVSGVNLDEEAANLIRFQQSYAASAKILSTAQDLFNTILQAAR